MADNSAQFTIDLVAKDGGIKSAAEALDQYTRRLTESSSAVEAANAALRAGEQAYKQSETAADRAAKALERVNLQAEAQQEKMRKAAEANNPAAYQRAATALENFRQRQQEATKAADAAKATLVEQAANVDRLRTSASAAVQTEQNFANAVRQTNDEIKARTAALQTLAREQEKMQRAVLAAKDKAAREEEGLQQLLDKQAQQRDRNRLQNEILVARDRDKLRASAAQHAEDAAKKQQDAQAKALPGNFKANEAAEAFGKLGGPLGAAGQKVFGLTGGFDKLNKVIGAGGPYVAAAVAIVAVTAAVAALTAAVAVGVVQITAWAVSLADAARSNSLLLQGIAHSVEGGALLETRIDELTRKIPLSSEELQQMASTLAATGLRGNDLANSLQNAAVKAAKLKFGPDFQEEMFSIGQQSRVLRANLSNIFGGLKIDALLKALQTLGELFDTDYASGRALKSVFESLFQPLVDGATGMVPTVRRALLQFELLALKAILAVKPWGAILVATAEVVLLLAAAITLGLVVALGLLAIGMTIFMAPLILGIGLLGALVAGVVYAGKAIYDFFSTLSLKDLGLQLINGLIEGLKSGASAVVEAVKSTASDAIKAAKSVLGIKSPSTVFAEIGMHTAAGFEQGISAGSDGPQSALESMTAPPDARPGNGGKAGAGASLSGVSFNFYGVAGAEDAESRFAEALTRILEGDAAQLGSAVPT